MSTAQWLTFKSVNESLNGEAAKVKASEQYDNFGEGEWKCSWGEQVVLASCPPLGDNTSSLDPVLVTLSSMPFAAT